MLSSRSRYGLSNLELQASQKRQSVSSAAEHRTWLRRQVLMKVGLFFAYFVALAVVLFLLA